MLIYIENGFRGAVGYIDCMKLDWTKFPLTEKRQYHNPKTSKLCDHYLYSWHWFAGWTWTNNEMNIIMRSRLMRDIIDGTFHYWPEAGLKLLRNGKFGTSSYFLVDGIYPKWLLFAEPIHQSATEGEKKYSAIQESVRKDIERMFGVLQSRLEIISQEFRQWYLEDILRISDTCSILHNMIIRMQQNEDSCDEGAGTDLVTEWYDVEQAAADERRSELQQNVATVTPQTIDDAEEEAERMIVTQMEYTDNVDFFSLRADLIAH